MYADMLNVDEVELVESVRSSIRLGNASVRSTFSNVSDSENTDDVLDDDEDDERDARRFDCDLWSACTDGMVIAGRRADRSFLESFGTMAGTDEEPSTTKKS